MVVTSGEVIRNSGWVYWLGTASEAAAELEAANSSEAMELSVWLWNFKDIFCEYNECQFVKVGDVLENEVVRKL